MSAFICAMLTACGGGIENTAKVPLAYNEYQTMQYTDARQQFENAGFTNINGIEKVTQNLNKEGIVNSIVIDGAHTFLRSEVYENDVPVEITYFKYEIPTISLKIKTEGEKGKPEFLIKTNLPDGTILNAELSFAGTLTEWTEDYLEQQQITVQDGKAKTEAFTNGGDVLKGEYHLSVMMFPNEQPESVQKIIGESGEKLTGDLVEKLDTYQYVSASDEYVSPFDPYWEAIMAQETAEAQEPEKPWEDVVAEIEATLKVSIGDDYTLMQDESGVTINLWSDGIALTAAAAQEGVASSADVWEEMISSVRSAEEKVRTLIRLAGYKDRIAVINIVNDQNHDLTLLTVSNGMILYDVVSGLDYLKN